MHGERARALGFTRRQAADTIAAADADQAPHVPLFTENEVHGNRRVPAGRA
ncbi:hypothetical protein GCM10023083_44150 [Streptomyces phyllanthi]